jgi:hypothetical protein
MTLYKLFGVCKSHKYLKNLCCLIFWSMKIPLRACFHQKKFQKKVGRKFIRVRIRIRTFSKVGSGSGQTSSGPATLTVAVHVVFTTKYILQNIISQKFRLFFITHNSIKCKQHLSSKTHDFWRHKPLQWHDFSCGNHT